MADLMAPLMPPTPPRIQLGGKHRVWPRDCHWMQIPEGEPLPRKIPVGAIFLWNGQMWRKGVGILYRARPCVSGIIYQQWRRRDSRRWAKHVKAIRRGRA